MLRVLKNFQGQIGVKSLRIFPLFQSISDKNIEDIFGGEIRILFDKNLYK